MYSPLSIIMQCLQVGLLFTTLTLQMLISILFIIISSLAIEICYWLK